MIGNEIGTKSRQGLDAGAQLHIWHNDLFFTLPISVQFLSRFEIG
jgi:hypothetical protein